MSPNPCTRRRHRSPRGFTLLELLVIVLLIGLISSLILPALAKARQKAIARESLDYGRSIAVAFQNYAKENDGALVPVSLPKPGETEKANWVKLLDECGDSSLKARRKRFEIGYNRRLSRLRNLSSINKPSMTVAFGDTGEIENPDETNPDKWREAPRKSKHDKALVFETPDDKNWKTSRKRMLNRHLGRSSVIFADGGAVLVPVSVVGFQYQAGHPRALWDNK